MKVSGLISSTYDTGATAQLVGNILNANNISGGNVNVAAEGWWVNPKRVTITLTPMSWQTAADIEALVAQALRNGAEAYPELIWDVGEFTTIDATGVGPVGGVIGGGFNPGGGGSTNTGGGNTNTGGGGSTQSGSRTVLVRVTGSFGVIGMFTTDEPTAIRSRLQENGWNITSVTADSTAIYPGQSVSFLVTANVLNQYNDQTVVQNMISQLSGLMTGVSATIVRGGGSTGGGGLDDFLGDLALGLGLSSPIALLGLAIVAVVVLKK